MSVSAYPSARQGLDIMTRRQRVIGRLFQLGSFCTMLTCICASNDMTVSSEAEPLDRLRSKRNKNNLRSSHRTLLEETSLIDRFPYAVLKDIQDPVEPTDVAFFWHIPKSVGSNMKYILGTCLNKVIASHDGAQICGMESLEKNELELCESKVGTFMNVDTSDQAGIERAKRLQMAQSGLVDVVISNIVLPAITQFDSEHGGRAFAVFRHPVDRIVSTFYYLGRATWEVHYDPELASMSLLEYVQAGHYPSNWVTRNLLGKLRLSDPLTTEDIVTAKEILKRKVLVLIADDYQRSVQHLVSYFGWLNDDETDANNEVRECMENTYFNKKVNHIEYEQVAYDTEAYRLIAEQNAYDMHLYHYAKDLFEEREESMFASTKTV